MSIPSSSPEPVAIIGMACIFPKAPDVQTFWRNIIAQVDAIGEPLPEWDAERYLNSGYIQTSRGGFLNDLYRFDPLSFGIMPGSINGGEPDQFLALGIARDALADAGYASDRDYDHRDTGIILGHSAYLHSAQANHIQHYIVLDQTIELLQALFPSMNAEQAHSIRKLLKKKLRQSSADNATGLVPNVMTGRIANRLNLRGPNYIIDAACSSSLLAVGAAMDELRNGRSRMMIAGGINASLPAEAAVIFTQLDALSKSGRIRPFDAAGDGTLLGEGAGMLVLKRLSDAMADGDRIYALIRGLGIASDGKAVSLLAPSMAGEALAIERAYQSCGIDPATIELIEAHGTGIPLGDKTELTALKSIFGERKAAQGHIALGTVKSMIGHCIPAAGIAGLIKSALALHHRALPPTLCRTVNPDLGIQETPFYINTSPRPWISRKDAPRRAAVNAFGFGGINTHAILEEAPARAERPLEFTRWPFELLVFSDHDKDSLISQLETTESLLSAQPDTAPCDLAAHLFANDRKGTFRLAVVARDTQDIIKKLNESIRLLREKKVESWSTRSGLVYSSSPVDGKIAFMFPGEGSQYLGMFEDLALYFSEARQWLGFWRGLYGEPAGESRTDILYPPSGDLSDQRRTLLEARLHDMDVGSEAVFIASQAMHAMLKQMGVQPDVMVGHSTGESSALAASGAMAYNSFEQLGNYIKELNRSYRQVLAKGQIPTGALLSVGALPLSAIEDKLAGGKGDMVIAMDNCANQLILFGPRHAMDDMQRTLSAAGGICMPLPFDRGYHTPLFSAVSEAFAAYYDRIQLTRPNLPLYSCASAGLFPDDEQGVRELAARQWSVQVRFRETIARMHSDGVRYFVEVGPSGNLCAFVNDILSSQEHVALATNVRRKNDVQQFLTVLAHLYANGKHVQFDRLFVSRQITPFGSKTAASNKSSAMRIDNTMPVVHIDPSDRMVLQAVLQEILPKPEKSRVQQPVAPTSPGQGDWVNPSSPLVQNSEPDKVMADYFDLMKHFLDHQYRVLECQDRCGSCSPGEEENEILSPAAPFLHAITEMDEHHLVADCRLCVHEDNFLRHHILSGPVSENDPDLFGLSCVPLMVSLEIMAEACAVLYGSAHVCAIEHIKASAWIVLDEDEVTLWAHAERVKGDNSRIRARLINHTTGGTTAVTADFIFRADWRAQGLPALREKKPFCWDDKDLYARGMFHGPIFQSIQRIQGWDEHGIDAALSEVSLTHFFSSDETPDMVLNPVLLDALGQLAAYWIVQQVGTDFNCFPSTIERIELYRLCPQQVDGMTCRARQHPLDPSLKTIGAPRIWRFECLDGEGQPLLRATDLVNVYYSVPHPFYQVRMDPLNGWLGHLATMQAVPHAVIWKLPHLTETFCSQSGGIFLNILAHVFLDFEERISWRQLNGKLGYRMQWLFGRACLKEAVRFWIHRQTGKLVYPADISVLHDDLGAPYVDGWWNGTVAQAPEVSLSHDKQVSVVAVTPPKLPVGIDIEHIGRFERSDRFERAMMEGALSAGERDMLHGFTGNDLKQRILRVWCAKEAAAKYLGIGLNGMPQDFQVAFLDKDWMLANVRYNGSTVEVVIDRNDTEIVALAGVDKEKRWV